MENLPNETQKRRYRRHLENLPGFTEDSQRALRRARVLVVGLGGLGSPVTLYLAAAGVGTLGLADADTVEVSNLQRQILHRTDDIGVEKVHSARAALNALNPEVELRTHPEGLTVQNAKKLFAAYDMVADCTDNFAARFLANDAAVLGGVPLVHAGVSHYETQLMLIDSARGTPCLRCVCPEVPPMPTQTPGVLGPVAGIAGALQATMIIRALCGIGHSMAGRLVHFDALEMRARNLRVQRNCDCPVCGTSPTITALCPERYLKK